MNILFWIWAVVGGVVMLALSIFAGMVIWATIVTYRDKPSERYFIKMEVMGLGIMVAILYVSTVYL